MQKIHYITLFYTIKFHDVQRNVSNVNTFDERKLKTRKFKTLTSLTDGHWGKMDEQLYLRDRYNSVVGGRIVLCMP